MPSSNPLISFNLTEGGRVMSQRSFIEGSIHITIIIPQGGYY